MLKVWAVMATSERSVPSNLSGFETLGFSDMFRDICAGVCTWACMGVDVDVGVISSIKMPRARDSLERGILTVGVDVAFSQC